jgi:hypothetical protein
MANSASGTPCPLTNRPTPLRYSAKHHGLAVAPARFGRAQTPASRRATHARRPQQDLASQTRKATSCALPARDRITVLAGRLCQTCFVEGHLGAYCSLRNGVRLSHHRRLLSLLCRPR